MSLGAVSVETPVAAVLGEWTETYHRVMPLALPLWLELAAPIVLAYGFAPGPRKRPDAEQVALQAALEAVHAEIEKLQAALRKVKRRKNGRQPRKPTPPTTTADVVTLPKRKVS